MGESADADLRRHRPARSTAPRPRSRSSTRGDRARPGHAADPRPALRPRRARRARRRAAARPRLRRPAPRAGGVHRHPAPDGAQGRGRRRAGLRQLRPPPASRSPATSQAARAVAGEGRLVVAFQPHLVSRTRIFGAAMGEALGAADEVVVLDVYLAREDADPAVTGALVADAVPLPAGAGRPSCPTSPTSPAALADAGPARRPGADPRRRRRHRGRARGCWSCSRSAPMRSRHATDDPADDAGRRATPQPAAVRAPAVGAALAGLAVRRRSLLLLVALVVGAVWLVFFSSVLAVQRRRGRGHQTLLGRARCARRPTCPTGEPLARVDLDRDPGPGRGARRRCSRPTSPGTWPDAVADQVERARRRSPSSSIGGRLRGHGRRRRGLPRLPPAPDGPAAASRPPTDTGSDALREARRGRLGAARRPGRPGRPRRGGDRRPDHAGAARRPRRCMWGSAEESEREGRGAGRAARSRPAPTYDVSVPGQPTTSD